MSSFKDYISDKLAKYVPEHLIKQSLEGATQLTNSFFCLIEQERIPDEGVSKHAIETFLYFLSSLDSNNHSKNSAIGERESRIFSSLVSFRNYSFGHGIGRSGDLNEVQPKAVGSSILYQITNKLAKHALKLSHMDGVSDCIVVPMATGMTLALCFTALSKKRKQAKYIVWPRIDQKSCFKSILMAGFTPLIIQNRLEDDQIVTDLASIEQSIVQHGAESIVCVMSTTSCFAPRSPDSIFEIGEICKKYGVPHVVNNAYGVQVARYAQQISETLKRSRLDLIVQSTDKNFMVPVGGSIVASPCPGLIKIVAGCYAGRASLSPTIDLFITLLDMGTRGYTSLLDERKARFIELKVMLSKMADDFGVRLLQTDRNAISLGLALNQMTVDSTLIGRQLFYRSVSGCRVVQLGSTKVIDGYEFKNWGAHIDSYHSDYLTCAASIGVTATDLESFDKRLRSVLREFLPSNKSSQ